MSRSTRSLGVVAGALALVALPLAGAASAHVTVQGPGATQGGYTKLTFRVPTEKDVATTKVEIVFPDDTPIAGVRVKPHPGWTAELIKGAPPAPLEIHGREVTEVVQRIVWTTSGPGIAADEFDEFEVSAGPLPEVPTMTFKALQTYADGEVVRWIEESTEGGAEPEKPAPVLELAPAGEDAHGGGGDPTPAPEETTLDADPVASAEPVASTSGVAYAGLGLGALGLLAGGTALVRGRRT